MDTFHFVAGWVPLTNVWNTVLAKHLLVFLVNLVHTHVCMGCACKCVCTVLLSITVIDCILLISMPCLWLYPCSWNPRGLLSIAFVAPTFYCASCSGEPWPLNCVKFTSFMGRGSANMHRLHVGLSKRFSHCLRGVYYACKQVDCVMVLFFTGCLRLPLKKKQCNLGYFYLVINGRPQSPKQYDVLFLLKLYSPKCSSIYIVIY